jgi:hypothetical protein
MERLSTSSAAGGQRVGLRARDGRGEILFVLLGAAAVGAVRFVAGLFERFRWVEGGLRGLKCGIDREEQSEKHHQNAEAFHLITFVGVGRVDTARWRFYSFRACTGGTSARVELRTKRTHHLRHENDR